MLPAEIICDHVRSKLREDSSAYGPKRYGLFSSSLVFGVTVLATSDDKAELVDQLVWSLSDLNPNKVVLDLDKFRRDASTAAVAQ